MNKTALKNFATNARKELIEKVKAKAFRIGITAETIKKAQIESSDVIYIDGKPLDTTEKKQRQKLISRIKEIGYQQVVEEVAYTWFNRFTALRFMEVNNYLPTKVRVLSSNNADSSEPDIIKEALTVDLDINKEFVYDLKVNNKTEELFKYMVIKQCNSLNKVLPFMFETIDDYKEILFPDGLLVKDSFLREMTDVTAISEMDWEQVEVIGWLYQYYNSDEKDRVYEGREKHKKEEIPYVTQLFTPSWIVKYMVQNSLGTYWLESYPEHKDLINKWEYYVNSASTEIDSEHSIKKDLRVEDIKCFDPAMGSGHILVCMFDVLFDIYSKCGYMEKEIPRLIIENNLYGLDIDDRAYQLASFAVVMKAMKYNKRFLRSIDREGLQLNLASIQEVNDLTATDIFFIAGNNEEQNKIINNFLMQYQDSKIYGSLLRIDDTGLSIIKNRFDEIKENPVEDVFEVESRERVIRILPLLIKQTEILTCSYDILITNPPYINSGRMNTKLGEYLTKNFPDSKTDTCTAFMEIGYFLKHQGFLAMINQHSWMFLSSFEKLRKKVINGTTVYSMLHLGARAFEEIGGEVVQTTAFVLRNLNIKDKKGIYIRLTDYKDPKEKEIRTLESVSNPAVNYRFSIPMSYFIGISGVPIAYWINEKVKNIFQDNGKLGEITEPRQGFYSGDNDKFLRYWYEIEDNRFTIKKQDAGKWFPYNKGGEYRKWYGNNWYVVDWENDGHEIKNYKDGNGKLKSRPQNLEHMLCEGITWGLIGSGKASFRYFNQTYLSGHKGPFITFENHPENMLYWILGILNSKIAEEFLKILSPTMGFEVGHVKRIPLPLDKSRIDQVSRLVKENIALLKDEWDRKETSWDFTMSPLMNKKSNLMSESYLYYTQEINDIRDYVYKNEVEINDLVKSAYGLENVLDTTVNIDEVNISIDSAQESIKSFISYFIGCSFGRYGLEEKGLIFAGGEYEPSRYKVFKADEDNIIPLLTSEFFTDDIVLRFFEFVKITFGEETLHENIEFIADSLGKKVGESAKETVRRYLINDFFKDHLQTYKKKPIYWLFTSGKQKAFNCLIYMHRYDKSTLSRIRTDYLHELQNRMDAEKKSLLDVINGDGTTKEITNAKKELRSLDLKIEELRAYDEKLHHMADMQIEIDLDDGVAVNYTKFDGLLAPIK
ncbi:BREX-1 system adenine-specific DNA-methyltransferase PglX [Paenibacillus sp. F411]|uniref:BREX-1 system adenine-specific DNA-methyltransferase PglX n=1 Tax=Paenibacillus sp. F411 TaxID=2820239 RepID=UPI001AAF5002|nr:BREX-1 system adenine-specific DNA-methyltransferase PglX [Paenibacillus sp. F411]MBO2945632.1 BREX-1 system adenine-specific DNA-methyltransferase PglX [Paenibacillus sp. F411]